MNINIDRAVQNAESITLANKQRLSSNPNSSTAKEPTQMQRREKADIESQKAKKSIDWGKWGGRIAAAIAVVTAFFFIHLTTLIRNNQEQ